MTQVISNNVVRDMRPKKQTHGSQSRDHLPLNGQAPRVFSGVMPRIKLEKNTKKRN